MKSGGLFSLYLSSVATAEKLVKAGCGSIQDLRLPQFLSLLLGETQRAKVRFMGHIEKPITKKEAEDVLVCDGSGRTFFVAQKKLSRISVAIVWIQSTNLPLSVIGKSLSFQGALLLKLEQSEGYIVVSRDPTDDNASEFRPYSTTCLASV